MKAITLWQPWATFVALGLKHYETRSWSTDYRGLLAIHAAKKKIDDSDLMWMMRLSTWARESLGLEIPMSPEDFPLGCVVAKVRLKDCLRTESVYPTIQKLERELGNYGKNRFAWRLGEVEKIDPIPATGGRMFWNWEPPNVSSAND